MYCTTLYVTREHIEHSYVPLSIAFMVYLLHSLYCIYVLSHWL